ncbi:hypothetical protein CSB93_2344 [Pseudomonas paraeruginosa]|uniref:Uncharacterized protein n=1 Tax=Pseudomonas paraeruginosa TaxID=2994495 RepID=A0A2R3INF5_9PSED|nr:hypothetical protein CSB93_2344 [Pseudomonas paraeruginosa]
MALAAPPIILLLVFYPSLGLPREAAEMSGGTVRRFQSL